MLVSPYNKIVVPYNEISIYHIGTRDNITLKEENVDIGVHKPKQYDLHTLEDCIKATQQMTYDEEGYVVVDDKWNRVKIKSPAYVAVHHLKNNGDVNINSLIELIRTNEIEEFNIYFPEYREYVFKIKDKIEEIINGIEQQLKIIERKIYETQKDFALEVKDLPYCAFYFAWRKQKFLKPREWFWRNDNNKIKEWIKQCLN